MAIELLENAAGRLAPSDVNGRASMPYQGIGGYKPLGRKAAPPIRSCADFPADGDIQIDIAIVAAPAADSFGNCSGVTGPAACGPLGFALADAQYAGHVIAVTDCLVPFPCVPWDIQGNYVDQVVVLDRVGDSAK